MAQLLLNHSTGLFSIDNKTPISLIELSKRNLALEKKKESFFKDSVSFNLDIDETTILLAGIYSSLDSNFSLNKIFLEIQSTLNENEMCQFYLDLTEEFCFQNYSNTAFPCQLLCVTKDDVFLVPLKLSV